LVPEDHKRDPSPTLQADQVAFRKRWQGLRWCDGGLPMTARQRRHSGRNSTLSGSAGTRGFGLGNWKSADPAVFRKKRSWAKRIDDSEIRFFRCLWPLSTRFIHTLPSPPRRNLLGNQITSRIYCESLGASKLKGENG
jgi:hypothetical protein